MAADALLTAIDFEERRSVPAPSKAKASEQLVGLPASTPAKVALLNAMAESKTRPADLARGMGLKPQEVTRILDLHHVTKIDTIADAFKALEFRVQGGGLNYIAYCRPRADLRCQSLFADRTCPPRQPRPTDAYSGMRLSQFIKRNIEPILVEWEAFARTMIPPAETMSVVELRDHAHEILLAIADEMETVQTEDQREAKSKGLASREAESFAAEHGGLRQRVGFDLTQLGAEYRALRATVLRQWMRDVKVVDMTVLEEVARFNEGIDQGLAEAMVTYSDNVANSRDTFLAVLGHDLRNPLSALRACVRMLELTSEADTKERALRIAKRSITSINEMVTDLLEYTRTRLGRGIDVQPKPGDFAALCHEAFDEVCTAYPERVLRAEIPEQTAL